MFLPVSIMSMAGAHAQQLHGAHRAAKARVDAQLHFRQAQRQPAVIHAHAVAAGQCQLHAAAQREALQQRNGGAGQGRDAVAQSLAAADHAPGHRPPTAES